MAEKVFWRRSELPKYDRANCITYTKSLFVDHHNLQFLRIKSSGQESSFSSLESHSSYKAWCLHNLNFSLNNFVFTGSLLSSCTVQNVWLQNTGRCPIKCSDWRLFLKMFWQYFDTVSRDHQLWRFHGDQFLTPMYFSVLINIITMVYGVICVFCLSRATFYQIRFNLGYVIPISVKYLF